jgi:hypothetical protein
MWVRTAFFFKYELDPPTPQLASKLSASLQTNEPQPRLVTAIAGASVVLSPTGGRWQRVNFTLPAANLTFGNCSLSIQITGGSALLLDAVMLEPAVEHRWQGMHVRKDIAEAIADAGLRFMRFGGDMAESAEKLPYGYTWRNQIGDPQRRVPKLNGAWYAWDSFGEYTLQSQQRVLCHHRLQTVTHLNLNLIGSRDGVRLWYV